MGHPAVDLDRIGRFVGGPDETGRLGRTPGHTEQSPQPLVGDPLLVPDLQGHRRLRTELLLGDLGQTGRRHRTGRLVHQAPGQTHGPGDPRPPSDAPAAGGGVQSETEDDEPVDLTALVLALVVHEPVGPEHRPLGRRLSGPALAVVGRPPRERRGQDQHGRPRAAGGPHEGGGHPAQLVAVELLRFPPAQIDHGRRVTAAQSHQGGRRPWP